MSYKWIELNKRVRRIADGACIPADSGNADWQAFQSWIAAGNAPLDADSPPPPPTADELEADAKSALNGGSNRIDYQKLIKAKMISDLAHRLGKTPASLTAAELLAERNRIAAIYKTL